MNTINYKIKLRNKDWEFSVEGDREFVEEYYNNLKCEIQNIQKTPDLIEGGENKIIKITYKPNSLPDEENDIIPLDVYLENYDINKLQNKFLGVALYLNEMMKIQNYKNADINNILKENGLKPIVGISTIAQRLRAKNLISIIRKEKNSSIYSIYKDKIKDVKDYLKLNTD